MSWLQKESLITLDMHGYIIGYDHSECAKHKSYHISLFNQIKPLGYNKQSCVLYELNRRCWGAPAPIQYHFARYTQHVPATSAS